MFKKILYINIVVIVCFFSAITLGLRLFGFDNYVVISDSMQPTLAENDFTYVKRIHPEEIQHKVKVGDIIAIKGQIPYMHRVVEIDDDIIITKGDANDDYDSPISHNDVIGVLMFSIPLIGILFRNMYPLIILSLLITIYYISKKIKKELKRK